LIYLYDINGETLKKIKSLVEEFDKEHAICAVIVEFSDRMLEVCRKIERSWSGSFAG